MKRSLMFMGVALTALLAVSCRGGRFHPTTTPVGDSSSSSQTTGGSQPGDSSGGTQTTTGSTGTSSTGSTGTSSTGTSGTSSTGTSSGTSTSSTRPSSSSTGTSMTSATSSTTSGGGGGISKKTLSYNYNDYIDNNAYTVSNCPTLGSGHILIIPVWFTDSDSFITSAKKASVKSDIQKAYLGSNSDTGWRSVKTYYEELSQNKLTLTGVVSEWYSCGKASSYYWADNDGRTNTLVSDATDWYFSSSGASRSTFDKDGNGFIDAVMLIYGAADYGAEGNVESHSNLWAYCYWLDATANKSSPNPCVYFWASYDFMYSSGDNANDATGYTYGGGDNSHCKIDTHTYIHEMGHVLGLEDYYDYSGQYNPAAGFSMQDNNVGSHDPYSVMAYGYADPYVPTQTTTINIGPFQSTHDLIVLSNHNASFNSPFDEYLCLELYTPTGLNEFDTSYRWNGNYPQGPNAYGIRLWHVDARLAYYADVESESPESDMVTNPEQGLVLHAMSNTYYNYEDEEADSNGYCSVLGNGYYDYNILQLIRKNGSTYKPSQSDDLKATHLFTAGSTFSMSGSNYSGQFKNSGKLNSNTNLGWSFTVDSCSSSGATITVTKL